VTLLAVIGMLGVSGCSKEKEKPEKGRVTAAASGGDCARCEKEKDMLASKLKAAQNQLRKLKRQRKATKRRR
jgi:hypothetical protein